MLKLKTIASCYHAVQHAAHLGERPLHLAYFVLVAWESHYTYGIVAAFLAFQTVVTFREPLA